MTAPVHLLAGFLGSGKTTLMNHALAHLPAASRPAIIVNDFGKIPIDGELIDRGDYALKELPSGCVCCTLKGPLAESLETLAREQDPTMVLMETTGVADPGAVAEVFRSQQLADRLRLGNVICVVDAATFTRYETHFNVLASQVQQSNTIVINKVDVASDAALTAVRQRIEYLRQPDSLVRETSHCNVDDEVIFDCRPVYFDVVRFAPIDHNQEFQSCSIESSEEYELAELEAALKGLQPGVVRGKGIVRTDQGVKLMQLTPAGLTVTDWEGEIEQSRLVFIGPDLKRADIEPCLDAAVRA